MHPRRSSAAPGSGSRPRRRRSRSGLRSSRLTAHHLDDHHPVVRLGRRVQAVDRLGGDRDGGVEAECVVGAAEVVVDRLRTPTTGKPCSAWSRAATPSVSSPPIATSASSPSLSKLRAPSRHRPRPCTGSSATCRGSCRPGAGSRRPRAGRVARRSRRQPAPPFAHPAISQPRSIAPPRRRADDGVQTRAITAACEDPDPSHGASLRRGECSRVWKQVMLIPGQRLSP